VTLPAGWSTAPIGDRCSLINGMAFKPTDWVKQGLPIIRIQNLNHPDAEFNYCDSVIDRKSSSRPMSFYLHGPERRAHHLGRIYGPAPPQSLINIFSV
jgi:hypothetical protein